MIQSVQRAAQILGVLGSGTPRLGVTEIAERVGLAKPTVHGLLRTLEAHDLVAQDPDTGKYSLGPGVLQLGNAYLDGSELRARSMRWAEALAAQAGEAVWVATLSGSRVIVLHHVFRPKNTGAIQALWASPVGSMLYDNAQALSRRLLTAWQQPTGWLSIPPGGIGLDVGCGPGSVTASLARAAGPDGLALGVDISEPMLARAAGTVAGPQIGFLRATRNGFPCATRRSTRWSRSPCCSWFRTRRRRSGRWCGCCDRADDWP